MKSGRVELPYWEAVGETGITRTNKTLQDKFDKLIS